MMGSRLLLSANSSLPPRPEKDLKLPPALIGPFQYPLSHSRESFDSRPRWVGERPGTESLVGEEPAPPWAVAGAPEKVCPTDEDLGLVAGSRVPC